MKFIIVFCFLIPFAQAETFKKKFEGSIPPACERVMTVDVGSIEGEVETFIHKIVSLTRRILDLKFESHDFFRNNRALYGEYSRLKQMKEDIEIQKENVQKIKDKKIADSDAMILQLSATEENLAKRIYIDLNQEREKEITRLNIQHNNLHQHWLNIRRPYYRSFGKWAPYENNLQELNKLELALMSSLKNLSEIHAISKALVDDLTRELSVPNDRILDDTQCQEIEKKLIELATTNG